MSAQNMMNAGVPDRAIVMGSALSIDFVQLWKVIQDFQSKIGDINNAIADVLAIYHSTDGWMVKFSAFFALVQKYGPEIVALAEEVLALIPK